MKRQIIRKALHLLKSKKDISRLKKSKGALLQFYHIVAESKNNNWTNEEQKALTTIKNLRSYYLESHEFIEITDFGFGKASDSRTDEQMLKGVESSKKVSEIYKSASSSEKQGELMFRIIRTYTPNLCFELGTCLGVSAAYGVSALEINNNGKYITLEGAEEFAKTALSSMQLFGLEKINIVVGRFQDTLPKLLRENMDIDFAFIDGHHEEKATIDYFEMFYEKLNEKSILIFDDINWSNGMRKAWTRLKKDSRINWTIDTYFRGICFIDKTSSSKSNYKVWF